MRFFIVSGYGYWGNIDPEELLAGERQVGGGETAMLNISKELAALGHEVVLFYDVARFGKFSGVDYLPLSMYIPMACNMDHDVLVSWDAPFALRYNDRATKRVLAIQLNDAFIGPFDWTIDYYFHPSRWHAQRFWGLYPEMTRDKSFWGLTNGIDYGRYVELDNVPRNSKRVIYSSSPDRGLHHLLRIWPRVALEVPEAELHVFYDAQKWLDNDAQVVAAGGTTVTSERAAAIREYLKRPPRSVYFHGGVGQSVLAIEQMKSGIMAYPCDPVRPTEGFSMSVLEGITAGCEVITTDADALNELWASAPGVTILPLPFDDEVWASTLISKLRNGGPADRIRVRSDLTWTALARRWEQILDDGDLHTTH